MDWRPAQLTYRAAVFVALEAFGGSGARERRQVVEAMGRLVEARKAVWCVDVAGTTGIVMPDAGKAM